MARNHRLFVRGYNVDSYCAAFSRDGFSITAIAEVVHLDAEELQTVANPLTDLRRMLTNAAGENEQIEAGQRGRICAHHLPGLISENVERLAGFWICISRGE